MGRGRSFPAGVFGAIWIGHIYGTEVDITSDILRQYFPEMD
jgi:hypothetical protein